MDPVVVVLGALSACCGLMSAAILAMEIKTLADRWSVANESYEKDPPAVAGRRASGLRIKDVERSPRHQRGR